MSLAAMIQEGIDDDLSSRKDWGGRGVSLAADLFDSIKSDVYRARGEVEAARRMQGTARAMEAEATAALVAAMTELKAASSVSDEGEA